MSSPLMDTFQRNMPPLTRNARLNSQSEHVELVPTDSDGGNRGRGRKTHVGQGEPEKTRADVSEKARGGRRGGPRGSSRGGLTGTRDMPGEFQQDGEQGNVRRRTVARGGGQRRGAAPEVVDDACNNSFFDDPGHGERLQARSGCLGTISSRGWEAKTNFLIDVYALINSSPVYKLKGL